MKVTNAAIYEAQAPLAELLKERLPIKTAYWLTKLARKISQEHADIHSARMKLFEQYGEEVAPNQWQVAADSAKREEFLAAQVDLMGLETEIDMEKVKIVATDDIKVTPEALLALEDFVEVE